MKAGDQFEILVQDFFREIQEITGEKGRVSRGDTIGTESSSRKCDIVIEHRHFGMNFRTLVECKDHGSRLPIRYIDEMAGRLNALHFNKGVIVCRSGFQKGAIKEAARVGIELYSLDDAKNVAHRVNLNLPILHLVLQIDELSLTFDVVPDFDPPMIGLTPSFSSEMDIRAFISKYVRPDPRCLSGKATRRIVLDEKLTLESRKQTSEGYILLQDHMLLNTEVYLKYRTRAFLGRVSNIDTFFVRRNAHSGEEDAFIPYTMISKLPEQLDYFGDEGAIPEYLYSGGFVTYSIDMQMDLQRRGLFVLKTVEETFVENFRELPRPGGKWLAVYSQADIYG